MNKHLSNNKNEQPESEARIRVLNILFVIIFLVYSGQLFSMQILSGDVYKNRAQDIAKRTTVIPAQRGEIFDRRNLQPLVYNTDSFAVSIAPAEIPAGKRTEVFEQLAKYLNVPITQIEKKIPSSSYYSYQPIEVASNITNNTIAVIAEHRDSLAGVSWQSKPIRSHSNLGSLSHIIGYTGDITRDELTTLYNKGYQSGNIIGKTGIEKQYDELLRGKEGRETRIVDVRGKRIENASDIIIDEPEAGRNLVLTIDGRIQSLAEKALGKRMGAVVVMRPTTGEILAMVSYPWFNLEIFSSSDFDTKYQALINDINNPLLNRAIQSSYPPGSTYKVVMTSGIIAENAFPSEQTIDCLGELFYGDRIWRCHIRKPGHGRLNLRRALGQSCDIYFWIAGRDYLGVERIVSYSKDFGFGDLTGIDLPGEISGFIPTPQWKERHFHERWQNGDTMNMSIGQGYTLVTPLQMANMVAMTVNDGIIYTPHVLKEVRDPQSGAVTQTVQRKVLHESYIKGQVFETVRSNMRSVVSEGTAQYPVNIKSVEIAGKTGTSEIGLADRWHSWFAAFAPYQTENPEERIVVSIIVEAVNDWEWWAPYASAIIFQGYFENQSYEDAVASLGFQYLAPIQDRRE